VSGVIAKEQYKGEYAENSIQYRFNLFSATNMTVGVANITINGSKFRVQSSKGYI
jgi:hypothetical protein